MSPGSARLLATGILLLALTAQPAASVGSFVGDPLTVSLSRGIVYPGDVLVVALSARNADGSGRTASASNLRIDLYDPDNLLAATVTPTEITSPAAAGAYRFAFTFTSGAKLGSYVIVARTTDVLPTSSVTAFNVAAAPPATLAQVQAAIESARLDLAGRIAATQAHVDTSLASVQTTLHGDVTASQAAIQGDVAASQTAIQSDVADAQSAIEAHVDAALDDAVSWAMDQANVTFHVENITIDHERLQSIDWNLTQLQNQTELHVHSLEEHRRLSPEYTADEAKQSWLDTIGQLAWVIWGLYFVATRFVRPPLLRILVDLVGFGLLALPIPESQANILFFAPLAATGWDVFRYTEEHL